MSGTDKLNILLVEDSALTAERLSEMMQARLPDASCTVVSSETEALKKIAETHFDAAVLDVRLNEGSGFGVLRALASLTPKPFLVVITNYALPKYHSFSLLAGADYFLDKATNIVTLPDLLSQHFEATTEANSAAS
jgi:two-component system OmpR family response regulator